MSKRSAEEAGLAFAPQEPNPEAKAPGPEVKAPGPDPKRRKVDLAGEIRRMIVKYEKALEDCKTLIAEHRRENAQKLMVISQINDYSRRLRENARETKECHAEREDVLMRLVTPVPVGVLDLGEAIREADRLLLRIAQLGEEETLLRKTRQVLDVPYHFYVCRVMDLEAQFAELPADLPTKEIRISLSDVLFGGPGPSPMDMVTEADELDRREQGDWHRLKTLRETYSRLVSGGLG